MKAPARRALRNALFAIFTKSQSAVFSYLTTLLLLRAMDVPEFGLYSVLFTAVLIDLTLLGQLGFPGLLVRFIPSYFARREFGQIGRMTAQIQLVQTAVALVIAAIVILLAPQIAGWVNAPGSTAIIRIFAVGLVLYIVQENYRVVLNGLFNQRAIFTVNVAYNAVRFAALYVITTRAFSLWNVVAAEVAIFGAALGFYILAYRRSMRQLKAGGAETSEPLPWRRFRRYAGLSYINEVGVALAGVATDLLLVSAFLGGSAAGFYGLATRIITLARGVMPNRVLSSVIEPLFYSEYGGPNAGSARFGFVLITKFMLWVSLPAAIWLAMMSGPLIVHFFDPQYAAAAAVVSLLAVSLAMETLRFPYGLALFNAERIDLLIYVKVSALFKIGLGLWLVPKGGMVAMAAIAAVTTLLEVILMHYFVTSRLKLRNDLPGILRLLVNAAVAGAVLWPARDYLDSRPGVLLSMVIYSAVYLGISLWHRAFTPEEREFINGKLPVRLWKF